MLPAELPAHGPVSAPRSPGRRRDRRGPAALRVAVTVAAVALVLGPVLPAAAHDDLVGSEPAEGERLETAPESVSLTFTSEVLTIGAAVVVADAAGTDWVATDPVVRDGTVTVGLAADLPDGAYQIRWRVVSEDGHPISDVVPFTVGDAEPLAAPAAPSAPVPTPGPVVAPAAGDTARTLLIGAAGAVVALGLYTLGLVMGRRDHGGPSPSARTAPHP